MDLSQNGTAAGAASLRSYIAARDSRTMMAVLDAVCQLRDPGSGELRCRWFTALPSREEQPGYYEQILRPLTLGTIRKRAEALVEKGEALGTHRQPAMCGSQPEPSMPARQAS